MDTLPSRDRTLAPGRYCFGRFELSRCLGEGGMGAVWLAQDHTLDRLVALKFLSDAVRLDPGALAALKRETKHSLKLTHPNIVRVYDWFEDAAHAAICLEYVDGSNLQLLKAARTGGCYDPEDLHPIVEQLCDALAYAHEQARVVHRDLKPANLLLDREGRLKIVDFGIAISLAAGATRMQPSDATSGTIAFMSPQQVSGSEASASDDLYSLGATLYDLLTGRPPFLDGDLSYQVRELPPVPPSTRRKALSPPRAALPPPWETTILALLSKAPGERPSAARVRDILVGRASPPPPPPAPPVPDGPAKPARRGSWGRSSVLISAIGAAAWVTVVIATRNPPHRTAPALPAAAQHPARMAATPERSIVPPPAPAPLPQLGVPAEGRSIPTELETILDVYSASPAKARAAWLERRVEFSGYVAQIRGSDAANPARLVVREDGDSPGVDGTEGPAWSIVLPFAEARSWKQGTRVQVTGTVWALGKDGVTVRDARIQTE